MEKDYNLREHNSSPPFRKGSSCVREDKMSNESQKSLNSAQNKIQILMGDFEFGSPTYNKLSEIYNELKVTEYHL